MFIDIDEDAKFEEVDFNSIRGDLKNLSTRVLIRLNWVITDLLDDREVE